MACERLLRLTKKCPGYVVSGLRNASVGIATVTQESFESQYYITQALFGTRSLFTMTVPTSAKYKMPVLTRMTILSYNCFWSSEYVMILSYCLMQITHGKKEGTCEPDDVILIILVRI